MPDKLAHPNPLKTLKRYTPARVALGQSGASLPTSEILNLAIAHAQAKDAVNKSVDFNQLAIQLAAAGYETIQVESAATNAADYLLRPDLGRRLSDASTALLQNRTSSKPCDIALILADGLSALAAESHGVAAVTVFATQLRAANFTLAPIILARHARVALQDPIGQILRAQLAIILLGERPGLGSADSLGAYIVYNPHPANTDANRNCVSNIRPQGLPIEQAAQTITYLVEQSLTRKISGVTLKDDRPHNQIASD